MSHITRDLIATSPGGPMPVWGILLFVAGFGLAIWLAYLFVEHLTRP